MNLTLKRNEFRPDGIFGQLFDENGTQVAVTLEHAFPLPDGSFEAAIPAGTYTCVRGEFRLEHMTSNFTTFEVTDVPGHTDILFHMGNFQEDSKGCILVGLSVQTAVTCKMITHSDDTFKAFMNFEKGVDQFTLVVV